MAVEANEVYDFLILYGGGSAFNTIYALSRSAVFAPSYATMFDSFVTDTGFSVPIYQVPQPSTCFYGGPGQSPPLISPVDPEKMTGVW